jgi:hypothetical protein
MLPSALNSLPKSILWMIWLNKWWIKDKTSFIASNTLQVSYHKPCGCTDHPASQSYASIWYHVIRDCRHTEVQRHGFFQKHGVFRHFQAFINMPLLGKRPDDKRSFF